MIPAKVSAIVDERDEKVCAVGGCERPARSLADGSRVCLMHWKRWKRNGHFDLVRRSAPRRPARGTCVVSDCTETDDGPHGYCKKHMTRIRRHGDPDVVLPAGVLRGPDNPNWNDAGLTYSGAHLRVRKARGRAREHACGDCGNRAAHWSYDRTDPAERSSEFGPFSIDPAHYTPRCVPCHKAFDLASIKGGAA